MSKLDAVKKLLRNIDAEDLPKDVNLPPQHTRAVDLGEEVDFNYRLDPLEDIRYAVKDNEVVGHLGLDDSKKVKASFVDPDHRREGIAEKMYEDAALERGGISSDDFDAMEPEAKSLWEKLSEKYPESVSKGDSSYSMNPIEGKLKLNSRNSDMLQSLLKKAAAKGSVALDAGLEALDKPGRAMRAGIGAYQDDEDVMGAIKSQFNDDAPEAPSGADLAEKFGDKYDVQSPAALAALATAADFVDPTMVIPGGQVTKLGKLKVLDKAAKGGKTADILKDGQKMRRGDLIKKPFGSVEVKPEAPVNPGKVMVKDDMSTPGRVTVREDIQSPGRVTVKEDKPRDVGSVFNTGSGDDESMQQILNQIRMLKEKGKL